MRIDGAGSKRLRVGGLLASAAVMLALVPAAAAAATTCTPATNIEAIVDDSGSMLGSDTNALRA
jgi:hypothetical protein